jgi:hypothetical protein
MELEPGDKKSLGIGHVIANLHVCKIIDFLRLSEASSSPTGHQRPSVDAYFVRQVTNFPILFLYRLALDVCLPDNNRKQRAMFEKLKQACVKARPCRVQRAHRRARSRDKNRCFRVLNLPIPAGCDATPGAISWCYYSPFMNWTPAF